MFRVTEENPGKTTTIMNRGGMFVVIREPTDPRWREEREALPRSGPFFQSEPLCSLQSRHAMQGQVTIELVKTIHGYWSLRNLMSLGDTFPAGRRTDLRTLDEAIGAATEWWSQKPTHREVIIRGTEIEGLGI